MTDYHKWDTFVAEMSDEEEDPPRPENPPEEDELLARVGRGNALTPDGRIQHLVFTAASLYVSQPILLLIHRRQSQRGLSQLKGPHRSTLSWSGELNGTGAAWRPGNARGNALSTNATPGHNVCPLRLLSFDHLLHFAVIDA
eukprot:702102-Prorocentrum_minimum.AAC.3